MVREVKDVVQSEDHSSSSTPRRRTIAYLLGILSILCVGVGWSIASPVGSSPDDDFHLGSIWCPRPVEESCEIAYVDGLKMVEVPIAASEESRACYAFLSQVSAGCIVGFSDDDWELSYRYDEGNYPKGYYRFHHFFVGHDVQRSAISMRLVNVVFAVALLGTVGAVAPDRVRRALSVSVVASWFPMGVYFIASNNPTSWAITGIFAFVTGLYASTASRGWRRWLLLVCAAAGALMCLASRYDASFYLFVVGLALLIAVRWSPRRHWPELIGILLAAVIGVSAMLSAGNQSAIPGSEGEAASSAGFSIPHFVWALATTPKYIGGFFGLHWGPGWGDVRTSEHGPFVLAILACGATLLLATKRGSWRKWLSALVILGAIAGLPAVFHASGVFPELLAYQARYILPLFAVLLFFLLIDGMEKTAWLSRSQLIFLTILISGAHLVTHYMVLLRFTRGTLDGQPRLLVGDVEWWWNLPVTPFAVWLVTTCAATVFIAVALSTVRRAWVAIPRDLGDHSSGESEPACVMVGAHDHAGKRQTQ